MEAPALNRLEPWIICLLSAVVFVISNFLFLADPHIVNNDVRQQIYWMEQYRDPELFQDHYLTEYAKLYVPPGVKALYRLFSPIISPLYLTKIIPGPQYVLMGVCLFLIGLEYGGRRLAWACAASFWMMPFFISSMGGGLARSFAPPLLCLLWLAWLRGWAWLSGLTLALMALFIPYIFVLAAGALGLAWLTIPLSRFSRLKPARPPFLTRPVHWVVLLAGAALVFYLNHKLARAGFGPWISASEAARMPELHSGGRLAIIPIHSLPWELTMGAWARIAPFRELDPWGGGIVCGLILIVTGAGLAAEWRYRRAGESWYRFGAKAEPILFIGLAAVVLHSAASILAFRLFMPDRFVIYPLHLFYCLFLALAWLSFFRRWLERPRWPLVLMILALVVGVARSYHQGLNDYRKLIPVYQAVQALPKKARLAGHPYTMDNVQTFGQRPVLVNYEQAHPWSKGLWKEEDRRLRDLFAAYYSADPGLIRDFCQRYRITHLVVEKARYDPGFIQQGAFFAPYDKLVQGLVGPDQEFVLLRDDFGRRSRVAPGIWLVDVRSPAD